MRNCYGSRNIEQSAGDNDNVSEEKNRIIYFRTDFLTDFIILS